MEKNLSSLDLKRLPSKAAQQVRTLLEGDFVGRNDNVLIFGNPGSGKSHVACAIGQELIRSGRKVMFATCRLDGSRSVGREAQPEACAVFSRRFPDMRC